MDTAAGYFGKIMEELFLYRRDEWELSLRKMVLLWGIGTFRYGEQCNCPGICETGGGNGPEQYELPQVV